MFCQDRIKTWYHIAKHIRVFLLENGFIGIIEKTFDFAWNGSRWGILNLSAKSTLLSYWLNVRNPFFLCQLRFKIYAIFNFFVLILQAEKSYGTFFCYWYYFLNKCILLWQLSSYNYSFLWYRFINLNIQIWMLWFGVTLLLLWVDNGHF